ncbi:TonB family protein [Rudanella paleaurantiibacter]|uniref:TonB family protein n=1 Tax=Rudanella paleaurantiibacter TaxID=2614655 RepID=A0A7J5U4W4_9BACT|nr:energy transducer TonB [Rudanella paleaurantiibacter]KAB7732879.1 TonB family protein [Rudanella paleaurantiibacter]
MNRLLVFILGLLYHTASAQSTTYENYEVDQPAEARGGQALLDKFMSTNVRKPFLAQVANINGLVVVQGIVEPNGRIAEVTVLKSLRPDCDHEAVRAFSLFNAWKPALKNGQPVRQRVTYPVRFVPTGPLQYANGRVLRYYDRNMVLVEPFDTTAFYRAESFTDTLGYPTGPLHLWKRHGKRWRKEADLEFFPEAYNTGQTLLIYRMPNFAGFGPVFIHDAQRRLVSDYLQAPDGRIGLRLDRDANGMVTRRTDPVHSYFVYTDWYPNGQIKSVWIPPHRTDKPVPEQMLAYWDSTGQQLVSEGNGAIRFRYPKSWKSLRQYGQLVDQTNENRYERGFREGLTTGILADSSYWIGEVYKAGVLQSWMVVLTGSPDTLRYTETDKSPQFMGGLDRLSQVLADRMQYPTALVGSSVEGYALVGFTVLIDGKISDVALVKGLHPAADAEALRVVQRTNGDWQAAQQQGRPVASRFILPVFFPKK